MPSRWLPWIGALLASAPFARAAGDPKLTPPDHDPVLRIDASGPTASVTSLAFSPDGKTLYAAGYDKVVRIWTLDETTGQFVPSSTRYRVPIGPGTSGVINCLAVSGDGLWLAVAGDMVFRGQSSLRESGFVVPNTVAMTRERWLDRGTIILFQTKTKEVRTLRGHSGIVVALAFAPASRGATPLLASAAREPEAASKGQAKLWTLDSKARSPELDSFDLPDPLHSNGLLVRPVLALWHSGDRPRDAGIAVARGDGTLRLRDCARRVTALRRDGPFNSSLAFASDNSLLLAGSYHAEQPEGNAQVRVFDFQRGDLSDRAVKLAARAIPRALSLFASKPRGALDHGAAVLRIPSDWALSRQEEFWLQAFNLRTFQAVARPIRLWQGITEEPALASAPSGRFIAVAGNLEPSIYVFAIADVLSGKQTPYQKLRSAGVTMRRVVFAKKGKDRGLFLSAESGRDWLFDFAHRSLIAKRDGWEPDEPTSSVRASQDALRKTGKGDAATASALLPAVAPLHIPILAVAWSEKGASYLALFNGTNGEQVRQLSGHVNPVRSLAFSSDGRLLASASDDQTVNVWSLTDLNQTIGREGFLRGVSLHEDDESGKRRLRLIADPNMVSPPNRERLRAAGVDRDAILEGIVEYGKTKHVESAAAFFQAVRRVLPGKPITVGVEPGKNIVLEVGQGIDERKPLLTLYVSGEPGAKKWDWLGWNPLGAYDSSDRAVERQIGWHQNQGTIEKPAVTFALADEYRKANFKPGILNDLLDAGAAAQAIDTWNRRQPAPAREPRMTLGIEENGRAIVSDPNGRYVVQDRRVSVSLRIDDFPLSKIDKALWRFNGQRGELATAGDGAWAANLGDATLPKGDHTLIVDVTTTGPNPVTYPRRIVLMYQPPRPRVVGVGNLPHAVKQASYPLEFRVTPGAGQNVSARVLHRVAGKAWHERKSIKGILSERALSETITLEPGANEIKVVVWNKDASADEPAESDWLAVPVMFQTPRPQIALESIELPDGSRLRIDPQKPNVAITVDEPTVRIRGRIEALEALESAQWKQADKAFTTFSGFDPARKPKSWPIDQSLTFAEPGKDMAVTVRAKAINSEASESQLTLRYLPRLPHATVRSPARDSVFIEGRDSHQVSVTAMLDWPGDKHPCHGEILLNAKPAGKEMAIAVGQREIQQTIALSPGSNDIQVRLVSEWQAPVTTPSVVVSYRLPPRVLRVREGALSHKPPRVTIEAAIETQNSRPLSHVEVQSWPARDTAAPSTRAEISIRGVPASSWKKQVGAERTTWTMTVLDVPLAEGKNHIRIVAANKDGECLETPIREVTYEKPVPPLAEVTILDPANNAVVTDGKIKLAFRVRSQSPLTRVQVARERDVLFDDSALKSEPARDTTITLDRTTDVPLQLGENFLTVVAVNEGGESRGQVAVVYRHAPVVRLFIDRLEEAQGRGEPAHAYEPAGEPRDGLVTFPPVSSGRQTLQGHLTWDAEFDSAMRQTSHIRVIVNGHQLLPVSLDRAKNGERRRDFEAPVALQLATNNLIQVRLPNNLVQDAGSHRGAMMACAHPVALQNFVHLLILSPEKTDEAALRDCVLESLNGSVASVDQIKVPGFAEGGQLYGPLIGDDLTANVLYSYIRRICQNLSRRSRHGSVNDVVMIYYRGPQTGAASDRILLAGGARPGVSPSPGLTFDELAGFFAPFQGAQLWLLDVTHPKTTVASSANPLGRRDDPQLAVWRYTWTGPPPEQKDDARLIAHLRSALDDAAKWDDVRQNLGKTFKGEHLPWQSKSYPGKLLYDFYMPPGLTGWPIRVDGGKKP